MSTREVLQLLSKAGVPAEPVNTIENLVEDPHLKAREMIARLAVGQDLVHIDVPGPLSTGVTLM